MGTGRVASGPWPASRKSPWPPSSPLSSFLRQSLPYKQEGGPQARSPPTPASSSYSPVFSAAQGSPPAPGPDGCLTWALSRWGGVGEGWGVLGFCHLGCPSSPSMGSRPLFAQALAPLPTAWFSCIFPLRQATRSQKGEQRLSPDLVPTQGP